MLSNGFCKSISIFPFNRPEWKPEFYLSITKDTCLYRILLSFKYSVVWSWIIFSMIFEVIGKGTLGEILKDTRILLLKKNYVWLISSYLESEIA